ncbi:helix-turn-helix transcriptional regulator [Sinorhizobium sp. NFACC03]|uniref:helix-turn-helix domain-containing protein n=1 Tax=Sinorhizobium sp. NFACC03 TaxID=1566295 RepID=UPI00088EF92C|nr:helix-turn-helix transcriptional regulator [Sinorhizobium sp. NFACC03]SDB00023.1 AraC-type DNA-binding protein [Sinorhizobium sp. NFACC03]
MPQKISQDHIKSMSFGPKSVGAEAWRNVSTIREEGVSYAISSLSMWTGLSAKVVEASCDRPVYNSDEADCSRLIVLLEQKDTRVAIGPHRTRRPTPTQDTPHQMAVGAPGARQFGFFDRPSGYMRWLVLQFDVALLGRQLGVGFEPADFTPRFMFHDPVLFQIAKRFEAACLGEEVRDTLHDDLLLVALLNGLGRLEHGADEKRPFALSQSQRRLLIDYMRARLMTNIRLSELCNLVQLSPFHFCRSFKKSLGVSPHAWQMRERIRVAQSMLRDNQTRLADVALAVGFYDQAHFTKSFKKIVGVTPGTWQDARCR